MDNQGQVLKELEPIDRYWFPALFIFPDNYAPEVEELPDVTLEDEAVEIDLGSKATDKDNLDAAIVKTVKSNSNEDVVEARIRNHRLTLQPKAVGEADLVIRFNSQRKIRGPYVARKIPHHRNPPHGRIPGTRMGQRRTHPHQGIATAHPRPHIRHGRTTDTQHGPVTGRLHRRLPGGKCYILKFNRKQYKLIY